MKEYYVTTDEIGAEHIWDGPWKTREEAEEVMRQLADMFGSARIEECEFQTLNRRYWKHHPKTEKEKEEAYKL
jgi:hypothetical protein